MSKENKAALWEKNVAEAKEIFGRATGAHQMRIAGLALEVCEITWGGAGKNDSYTLSRFAKESNIDVRTLSNWVGVRKHVYEKLPDSLTRKMNFTKLATISVNVSHDATKEDVKKKYDEVVNISSMDHQMRRYLGQIRGCAYSFEIRNAAEKCEEKTLQEYLFYCKTITRKILSVRPSLKPECHGIASKTPYRAISAAKAMNIPRNQNNRIIIKVGKSEISLTKKDRDIIHFLRASPDKFFTPTEIGMKLGGHSENSGSSWACRTLNKLMGTSMIERNKLGHYRWTGK